jgi:hypothetical protein
MDSNFRAITFVFMASSFVVYHTALSRPHLRAVQNTRDLHSAPLHSVDDDVWQSRNHKFMGSPHSPLPPHVRLLLQKLDLAFDPLTCLERSDQIILRDVILDPIKIGMRAPRPFDTHALRVTSCVSPKQSAFLAAHVS